MEITTNEIIFIHIILVIYFLGIFIGGITKEDKENRRKNSFKFIKLNSDMLRLNTSTGQVVIITNGIKETVIHKGKRFSSHVSAFDLIQTDEHCYILFDTSSGFYKLLNLETKDILC